MKAKPEVRSSNDESSPKLEVRMPNSRYQSNKKRRMRCSIAAAAAVLLACAAPQTGGTKDVKPTGAAKSMTLTSPAFTQGKAIPAKFTGDGQDVSPALAWAPVPESAASFALICRDPDAPSGTFIHWVVYNIPPAKEGLAGLPEALPKADKLTNGTIQGRNDFGRFGYNGPKPPPGKPHRYFFDLFALDTMLPAEAEVNAGRLQVMMTGHVIGTAELMGTYQR